LQEVEVSWHFERFDDYWRYVTELAGGIAMVLQAMPEADREAVRSLVEPDASTAPSSPRPDSFAQRASHHGPLRDERTTASAPARCSLRARSRTAEGMSAFLVFDQKSTISLPA